MWPPTARSAWRFPASTRSRSARKGDFSMQRVNVGRRPTAVRIAQDGQHGVCRQHVRRFDLDPRSGRPQGRRHDLARPAAGAVARPAGRAAVSRRQTLARRLDELPELPHRRPRQRPDERQFQRPLVRRAQARAVAPGRREGHAAPGLERPGARRWSGRFTTRSKTRCSAKRRSPGSRSRPSPPTSIRWSCRRRWMCSAARKTPPRSSAAGWSSTKRDCASCHAPPTYTSPEAYDVGLKRLARRNTSSIPPASAASRTAAPTSTTTAPPRWKTSSCKHGHPSGAEYSESDVKDLAAFLRSL